MSKKVTFNDRVTEHKLIVWQFTYKECRRKYWEIIALDRFRFQRRIDKFELQFKRMHENVDNTARINQKHSVTD